MAGSSVLGRDVYCDKTNFHGIAVTQDSKKSKMMTVLKNITDG